jgi:hypothetical protein
VFGRLLGEPRAAHNARRNDPVTLACYPRGGTRSEGGARDGRECDARHAPAGGLYLASVPYNVDDQAYRCAPDGCIAAIGQLTAEEVAALPRLGLSLGAYTWYMFLVYNAAIWLAWLALGLLIFWRRADEPIGLFTSLVLVVNVSMIQTSARLTAQPQLRLPDGVVEVVGLAGFGTLPYLFPDGRFVPRWTRWPALAFLLWEGPRLLLWPADTEIVEGVPGPPFELLVYFALGVAALVYRYVRVATPTQRQQVKWVGAAMALWPLSDLGVRGLLLPALFPVAAQPGPGRVVYYMVTIPLFGSLAFMLVPAAFAVAILRHRLYDIDLIIRRTLVYGALTACLALLYFGGVALLQQPLRPLLGQDNQLAVVASTLAIAALFQPLRRHLQATIDRRFYRRKYDAQRTLAAFGATLREETDLEQLRAHLLGVVQETMQPAHAALWLRPVERRAGAHERAMIDQPG